jgi:nucleotide-binding universal stress UspA family protein
MYKTILVPLDGSHRAERILPHVEKLAQQLKSKVVFMKVIAPDFGIPGPQGPDAQWNLDNMNRQLDEFQSYLDSIEGEFRQKGLQTKAVVEFGRVVRTIIEVADREGADLIAIASHGRSGLSQVFYGSVAAGVLHRADRPLLVIRAIGEN